MDDVRDVLSIGSLTGKLVLSLKTGNKLGELRDLSIDRVNGLVLGLVIAAPDGSSLGLPFSDIHNFGHHAVMAVSEAGLKPLEELPFASHPRAGDLIRTTIITASGDKLGQIRDVFVTLQPPPTVVYSIGESVLDRWLGRESFILASSSHAMSDDAEHLVVPDNTADKSAKSIAALLDPVLWVRSPGDRIETGVDDTWIVPPDDEFETVVHSDDDDDTVIRVRTGMATGGQTG